jgi:hypothetical protein
MLPIPCDVMPAGLHRTDGLHHLHLFLLGEPGIVRVNVGWGEISFRNRVA